MLMFVFWLVPAWSCFMDQFLLSYEQKENIQTDCSPLFLNPGKKALVQAYNQTFNKKFDFSDSPWCLT